MTDRVVLFDLDDTLTDARRFAADVLADAVSAHGRSLPSEVIAQYPGAPFGPLLRELLHVDEAEARQIYDTYVRRYRDTMAGVLRENDGADAVLRAIAAHDLRLGLVTNKLESLARAILAAFGWTELFGVVVGYDTCEFRKPHPGVVLHALRLLDGRPDATIFVGDTPGDMRCARDAGVPTVIGLLSTTAPEALTEAGATHLCADLHAVLAVIVSGA